MTHYVAPSWSSEAFSCPSCGAFAEQTWRQLQASLKGGGARATDVSITSCRACGEKAVWLSKTLIWPAGSDGPAPHDDLEGEARETYEEARAVARVSPRAAAGLLRLVTQQLVAELVPGEDNLNRAIGELVERGLSEDVQQTMDVLRVVGNNAVHPGEVDVRDAELVVALFELPNVIVEQVIAGPKRRRALYDALPEGARAAIDRRDGRPSGGL